MVAIDQLSVRLRDHLLGQHGYGRPSIIITIILDLVVGHWSLAFGPWSLVFGIWSLFFQVSLPSLSSEIIFRNSLPSFSSEFLLALSWPILARLDQTIVKHLLFRALSFLGWINSAARCQNAVCLMTNDSHSRLQLQAARTTIPHDAPRTHLALKYNFEMSYK